MSGPQTPPSALKAAFCFRCPACGQGRLYSGLLSVRDVCEACGMSLAAHEKGDGPAFFAITLVGFFITFLAAWVEFTYQPPYWLHAVLWLPLITVLSLYFLRFFKAMLIALQYRHMDWRR